MGSPISRWWHLARAFLLCILTWKMREQGSLPMSCCTSSHEGGDFALCLLRGAHLPTTPVALGLGSEILPLGAVLKLILWNSGSYQLRERMDSWLAMVEGD